MEAFLVKCLCYCIPGEWLQAPVSLWSHLNVKSWLPPIYIYVANTGKVYNWIEQSTVKGPFGYSKRPAQSAPNNIKPETDYRLAPPISNKEKPETQVLEKGHILKFLGRKHDVLHACLFQCQKLCVFKALSNFEHFWTLGIIIPNVLWSD